MKIIACLTQKSIVGSNFQTSLRNTAKRALFYKARFASDFVDIDLDTSNQLKSFVYEWYVFFELEANRNLLPENISIDTENLYGRVPH